MLRKIRVFLEMIKFEHTVFALPFAFMGALLGALRCWTSLPAWAEIGWIIVPWSERAARPWGLTGLSTRRSTTKIRVRRSGHYPPDCSPRGKWLFLLSYRLLLLFVATSQLIRLVDGAAADRCFLLWSFIRYTKRFTWLCHLVPRFNDRLGAAWRLGGRHGQLIRPRTHLFSRPCFLDRRALISLCLPGYRI